MPSESGFLKACRLEPVERTPVWIMRQAGRYLPEYRRMRDRHSMLEICRTPDLACEVTMQPLRRFELDAAILFSDLLIPVEAIGVAFDIVEGKGPVVESPLTTGERIEALDAPDLDRVGYVFDAVRHVKEALSGENRSTPLIGFAGAPFTVASYLIEGEPTRSFRKCKGMAFDDPGVFDVLLGRLADLLAAYVEAQVEAGVDAVQIFDSWVGSLSPALYRKHVMEPTRRVIEAARRGGVPVIHFGTMNAGIIDRMAEAGGDVIGIDWRMSLHEARARFPGRAIQGNLDPLALLAPRETLGRMIDEVLDDAGPEPGYIFNLGHGILPETPPDNLAFLVDRVHARTAR